MQSISSMHNVNLNQSVIMKKIYFHLFLACMSVSLISCAQNTKENTKTEMKAEADQPVQKADLTGLQQATFASGCFWCMEGVYESVKGVTEVISGYSGGKEQNPTYHQVGSGSTGHAESVNVYYDSTKVSYETLIKVYFASQNITQVDGQGPDEGTQYRSIIFYRNEAEKKIAQKYIDDLNASGKLDGPVAAQLLPFEKFWEAEDYHQDYIVHHPKESYVVYESIPRIKRFQAQYPELIKPERKF